MVELIDQLTEKLYQEGIEKAKQEAEKIIGSANKEKENIVKQAEEMAKKIIRDAQNKAETIKKATDGELRMTAEKVLATMRQGITQMITLSLSKETAQEISGDKQLLRDMVEKIISHWNTADYTNESLLIKLPAEDQKKMEEYFMHKAKNNLQAKIKFEPDNQIKAGFIIEPSQGNLRISFTDADISEFFQYFLRPRIKELLFGQKKDN